MNKDLSIMHQPYIISAKRTPIGGLLGQLSSLTAPQLGAAAIKAMLDELHLPKEQIQEVIMGCVLQAGIGQAPARQATLFSGLPNTTGATTINKMCGSGMKAIMIAADMIKAQSANLLIAGGMESMSQAPYLIAKARNGFRLGHGEIKDSMFLDGLEDAYEKNKLMGVFAETCAQHYGFTRAQQDKFALNSLNQALKAIESGAFLQEITPIEINDKNGIKLITQDEGPCPSKRDKISRLKPAFDKDGTITAANSSSISDGAATVMLASKEAITQYQLTPLAKIVGYCEYSQAPEWFTTAPIYAIEEVLKKSNWKISDVDLFEINEAFAVVTMATTKTLGLQEDRVNIHGGACALGHPIGASGARIVVSLIHALKQKGLKRGVAALCIGGGEATAMAIELC